MSWDSQARPPGQPGAGMMTGQRSGGPMQGHSGFAGPPMQGAPPSMPHQNMVGPPMQAGPPAAGHAAMPGQPGGPAGMQGHPGAGQGQHQQPPNMMPPSSPAGPRPMQGQMAGPPGAGSMAGPGAGRMAGPGAGQMAGPGAGQMAGPGAGQMAGPGAGQMGQMAGPRPGSAPSQQPPGGPMQSQPGFAGPPMQGVPPSMPHQNMAGPPMHAGPPAAGHAAMQGQPGGPNSAQGHPSMGPGPGQQQPPNMMPPSSHAGPPPMQGHPGAGQMAGPPGVGPGAGHMAGPPPMGGAVQMAGPGAGQMAGPGAGQMAGPGAGQMAGPGAGQMAGPGAGPAAPQQRISPESTPHPLAVWQADSDLYTGKTFYTNTPSMVPPLPMTSCHIVDQGNCSSRFMRSTLYNVPVAQEILHNCNIPLGLSIQPFAKVPQRENTIYVVNNGDTGPVRCRRCKGYINPHVSFVDGGRKFVCNLCNFANEVPDHYQCQLDQHGRRLDASERPELSYGSVEFLATTDYCKESKWPEPPAYIFLIEVTYQSVSSGLLNLLSRMLRLIFDELPKDTGEQKSKVRIGLATFDNTVHFYNLKASLAQPQMMVVADVNDVFLPLLDGFLVDVEESSSLIEAVLQELPNMYRETRETTSCLGPAVQAGLEALKAAGCAGKLFVFSSSMPKGDMPGMLKNREDRALFRTDKEKNLYAPQNPFYPDLGANCVKQGACIEMFNCSTASFVDIATMSSMVSATGGEIHLYPYFNIQTDGERLVKDLAHSVGRQTGFDAVMRVRCSSGLRATDFWGNLHMNNTTDVLLAGVDCDKAISVEVKYDDKLGEEGAQAYYQVALLYTSVGGQRRLRLHNLAVSCTKQLAEVYRCADMDTIMNMFLKKAVRKLQDTPYKSIRGHLLEQSIALLACYRKECSEPASGARLILPEALKLLPLYVCSLIKCEAVCAQSDSRIDDKAWLMHQVTCMPVTASVPYLYPTVMPVHTARPDDKGLPAPIRCYYEALQQEGIYLLENGFVLILWLGRFTHPAWVKDVFGVHSLAEIDTEKFGKLQVFDNPTSTRLRAIVAQLLARRSHCMKMVVVLQGSQKEALLRRHLCEDGGGEGTPSYMDLLCHIHKEIRNALA
ncbi:protein transport protein Sec24D-like isoform X2 [Sycon ciliatum]|uniref:protein transport protein Sec24D-like isoform X2 n=1 Tax=Sycon ciliatum TaxID=27933 RepID=UPI0031F5F1A3